MKDYISERAVELAQFIVDNKATVRAAAKAFNVSKSTVHTVATKKNISKSLCTMCKGFFRLWTNSKRVCFLLSGEFEVQPQVKSFLTTCASEMA